MGKEKKSFFNSISWQFIKIAYLPLIVLTIIVIIAGSTLVINSLNKEAEDGMVDLCDAFKLSLDQLYPGDYNVAMSSNNEVYLFKGEHQINGEFAYIDSIKEKTDCDISICYMNYAVITTLTDYNGERLVGKGDNSIVVEDVIDKGESKFYNDVLVGKKSYHAYYEPLKDKDGKVLGMICIAKPTDSIRRLANQAVYPIIIIGLLCMILATVFTYKYSKNFIEVLKKIQKYMKAISNGDFREELDNMVAKRSDELGDMGKSATKMAASLRKKVEEDQLTGLLNRRSAAKKMQATISNYTDKGVPFNVALGDIDFFKKVNDTYGHDAGDQVLVEVSNVLKNTMMGKGYAIRWGGEEFLLIFENYSFNQCVDIIEDMLDRIREMEVFSGEYTIKVNMTFGLTECNPEVTSYEKYVSSADAKLYYGKEHGRNQLVTVMEE